MLRLSRVLNCKYNLVFRRHSITYKLLLSSFNEQFLPPSSSSSSKYFLFIFTTIISHITINIYTMGQFDKTRRTLRSDEIICYHQTLIPLTKLFNYSTNKINLILYFAYATDHPQFSSYFLDFNLTIVNNV